MDWTTIGGSGGIAGAIVGAVKLVEGIRKSPSERSATQRADEAEEELGKALARIDLHEETIRARDEQIMQLERERSLSPILDLATQTNQASALVLEKLVVMNGSLTAVKVGLDESIRGLAAATEAIKLVAAQVLLQDRPGGGVSSGASR